jgi:hypothetical protein
MGGGFLLYMRKRMVGPWKNSSKGSDVESKKTFNPYGRRFFAFMRESPKPGRLLAASVALGTAEQESLVSRKTGALKSPGPAGGIIFEAEAVELLTIFV